MKTQTLKKLALLCFFALIAFDVQADILASGQKPKDIIGQVGSLESKNGFSAQFWMTTDEQIFSTWAKPGAIRGLKPITAVRRNTPVFLALFIANPGGRSVGKSTNPRFASDVSFDLYVISPNGTLSLAFQQRTAWKGTSPSPGLVYLARDRGTLNFEAIDALGEYNVVVILHDNVRKMDLKLTRKLELTD